MDIQSRKIAFIQEFLKLQSVDAIARLEKMLWKEKSATNTDELIPMTEEELNQRIDQSESDFQNKNFKSSAELLAKYD